MKDALDRFSDYLNSIDDRQLKKDLEELGIDDYQGEYLDDLNDIFPWIPRGTYRRVKEGVD